MTPISNREQAAQEKTDSDRTRATEVREQAAQKKTDSDREPSVSSSASLEQLHIDQLIEVPPVQTVVHLADLANPEQRSQLAENFVLTDEVKSHLRRLLWALGAPHGLGTFLRGHYGAGKSHFLAFYHLLLTRQVRLEALIDAAPELRELLQALQQRRFQVASVSLVEHSAQETLEAIVSKALETCSGPTPLPYPEDSELEAHLDTFRYHLKQHHQDSLELFLEENKVSEEQLFTAQKLALLDQLAREVRFQFRPDPGRAARFEHLFNGLESEGFDGIVLLMDELSEFLHSKSGAALAEDVRFLQYLGETASSRPFFIVAALQEYLEAAEYGLPGELVRKIKDRYPNNLELTTTHIEEIVSKRLIRHRPGAEPRILALHVELKSYLVGFPVAAQRFARAYPIHPATLLLLDRLKPLLSRSRGIVDFIHYRLRGSPERGLDGMLDAPADTLLTPDAIFDHFRLRIRENIEIAAYDTVVHEYYKQALERLFPDAEARELAHRIVKMLILLSISPEPKPYSVRTLTHALLVRVSRIDPDANFQHVRDILEQLVSEGAYVERLPARGSSHDGFDDVYALSLKADLNLVASRRIQAAVDSLRDAPDLRIFEALAPSLKLESLPLSSFLAGPQSFRIQWQRSPREGIVSVGSFVNVGVQDLVDRLRKLDESDADWALYIGVPYDRVAQRTHLDQVLLPALRRSSSESTRALLFWSPEALTFEGEDGDFLFETLARRAVLARAREEEGTSQARALIELLERGLEGDTARIETLFHQCYYRGQIESVAGVEEDISNLGRPLFAQTLLAVLTPVLAARYPDHSLCLPLGRLPELEDIEDIVDKLFKPGSYEPTGRNEEQLATRMIALLKPLGLVKKSGNSIVLSADVTKPGPGRVLYAMLELEPRPLIEVRRAMRKGRYGMDLPLFKVLVLGLAYAGSIVCYTKGRRREAGQLSALNFDQLSELSRAEEFAVDLSPLRGLPFLSDITIPKGELNFARQEKLWLGLRAARDRLLTTLGSLRRGLAGTQGHRALPGLDRGQLEADLVSLETLANVVRPGINARDGIVEFVRSVEAQPDIREKSARVDSVALFFSRHLERYLVITRYLERLGQLPTGLDYAELRQLRQELLAQSGNPGLLSRPEVMEQLDRGFKRFQNLYAESYRREHEKWRGPARFRAYEELRSSQAYLSLQRLARLDALAEDDHRGPLERQLNEVFRARCQRLGAEDLLTSPRCTCGFNLGDTLSLPTDEALLERIRAGVAAYLEALRRPTHLETLRKRSDELALLGKQREATRLRSLLTELQAVDIQAGGEMAGLSGGTADSSTGDGRAGRSDLAGRETAHEPGASNVGIVHPNVLRAASAIDESAVAEINTAISGSTLIEERDLELLTQQLRDRCLPRDEVQRVFLRWLGQGAELRPGTFIRFVQGAARASSAPSSLSPELEGLLRRRFPELEPLAKGIGEERLFLGAFLSQWCVEKGVSHLEHARLLRRWSGEDTVADEALERLPELAQAMRNGPRERLTRALELADALLSQEQWLGELAVTVGLEQSSLSELLEFFIGERTFASLLAHTAKAVIRKMNSSQAVSERGSFPDGLSVSERGSFPDGLSVNERGGFPDGLSESERGSFPSGLSASERGGFPSSANERGSFPSGLSESGELPEPLATPRRELGEALREEQTILKGLERLRGESPSDAQSWELSYLDRFALLPWRASRARAAFLRWGVMDRIEAMGARATLFELLEPLEARFQVFYRGVSRQEEDSAVERLDPLLGKMRRYARNMGDADPTYMVLDLFRWDLWQVLKGRIGALFGGNLQVIREEIGWAEAGRPAPKRRTSEAKISLAGEEKDAGEGVQALMFELARRDEGAGAARAASSPGAAPDGATEGMEARRATFESTRRHLRFPLIEDSLKRSSSPLATLLEELADTVLAVIRPALNAIPPGKIVILSGERGFREARDFDPADLTALPRYRTGGSSPWEILVPVVVIRRGR